MGDIRACIYSRDARSNLLHMSTLQSATRLGEPQFYVHPTYQANQASVLVDSFAWARIRARETVHISEDT